MKTTKRRPKPKKRPLISSPRIRPMPAKASSRSINEEDFFYGTKTRKNSEDETRKESPDQEHRDLGPLHRGGPDRHFRQAAFQQRYLRLGRQRLRGHRGLVSL